MKILPPTTHPPKQPLTRQHQPPLTDSKKGFHTFVPCLRWEFGFTCAFCLLHEGDLAEFGIKTNTGQFSVEHRELQKDDVNKPDKQANLYSNCFYACMLCNRARSDKPVTGEDNATLLDPTLHAWADHFEARDDHLIPRTPDAEHTSRVYRPDDPRKVLLRKTRRERIKKGIEVLSEGPAEVIQLKDCARRLAMSNDAVERGYAETLLRAAQRLSENVRASQQALERYQCVPEDARAASKCRCNRAALRIPAAFEQQAIDV